MCFNKETSMVVFLLGIVCAIKLFKNSYNCHQSKKYRYIVASVFLFFVASMQLIEYIIWKYQPIYKNCKKWLADNEINISNEFIDEELFPRQNIIAAYFLMVVLFFQLLFPFIAIMATDLIPQNWRVMTTLIFIVTTGLFITACVLMAKSDQRLLISEPVEECGDIDGQCRLSWGPIDFLGKNHSGVIISVSVFYMIMLAIIAYSVFSYSGVAVLIITILIAITAVYAYNNPIADTYGSIWCFGVIVFCCFGVVLDGIRFNDFPFYQKLDKALHIKRSSYPPTTNPILPK